MACRKCDVCQGSSHHWYDWLDGDEEDDLMDYEPGDPTHACKHCGQLGIECDHCYGEGRDCNTEDDTCPFCHGEGVIPFDAAAAN